MGGGRHSYRGVYSADLIGSVGTPTCAGNRFCGRIWPGFRGSPATSSPNASSRRGVGGGPGPTYACARILYAGEHVFAEHAAPGGGPSSPDVAADELQLLLACDARYMRGVDQLRRAVSCVSMRTMCYDRGTLSRHVSTVRFES